MGGCPKLLAHLIPHDRKHLGGGFWSREKMGEENFLGPNPALLSSTDATRSMGPVLHFEEGLQSWRQRNACHNLGMHCGCTGARKLDESGPLIAHVCLTCSCGMGDNGLCFLWVLPL